MLRQANRVARKKERSRTNDGRGILTLESSDSKLHRLTSKDQMGWGALVHHDFVSRSLKADPRSPLCNLPITSSGKVKKRVHLGNEATQGKGSPASDKLLSRDHDRR